MKASELPMRGLGDPRLAIHAAGSLPTWLWATDGTRVIWSNPVGARLLGVLHASDFDERVFGPADPHRRQVAQLAARLRVDGPLRLERLRGFGAPLGRFITCGCTKLALSDGSEAVLIVAAEAVGRPMPLSERLQRLVEDADVPLAAFGRDGVFVGASTAARTLLGFRNLSEAGLDAARMDALRTGRTETPIGLGNLVLQRVGKGAEVGLIASVEAAAVAATVKTSDATHQEHAPPFALYDEMSDFQEGDLIEPIEHATAPDTIDDMPENLTAHAEPIPDQDVADKTLPPRTMPLRFLWEIDPTEQFRVGSDELLTLLGPHAAAALDAPWQDVASAHASYGRMAAAIASQAAWSGISLSLPTDAWDEPLVADLSGIPAYTNGEFAGYRGFGIIHDLDALGRLDALRRRGAAEPMPQSLSAHTPSAPLLTEAHDEAAQDKPLPLVDEGFAHAAAPANVVHLRTPADGNGPALTPVENSAFDELARELAARLEADFPTASTTELPAVANDLSETRVNGSSAMALLDLAPVPMLVHRHGRVLHANTAWLALHGCADLAALQATAFDASTIENARSVAVDWSGETAQALIVDRPLVEPDFGVEDFAAILDAAEAILVFDAQGAIRACNRNAAELFGASGDALIGRDLATLFTPDTQAAITLLLERLAASSHEQSVEARISASGGETPLKLRMGRVRPDEARFYAIISDLTQNQRDETELAQARRQVERAGAEKADILARISHEMRAPLGAIIGFADVMIEQRFGPLGGDRYADYLRDIRSCGERVVAIVDDLLDLSRIESGKRHLALTPHDLNDLVEQCVASMQPRANRERIIIRSSLAHPLPPIVADAASLRQIALNLIDNSIHLANPGGQVIVSTVHADSGDVLLRVRDTGHGLNDNEVATALAPFRPSDDAGAPTQIRLSLTRALAEANSARFTVKPTPYAGTLIEVAFSASGGAH